MDFHGIHGLCQNVLGEQVIEMFLHTETGHCDFMRFCKVLGKILKVLLILPLFKQPSENQEIMRRRNNLSRKKSS
jgi:hypothetical protein